MPSVFGRILLVTGGSEFLADRTRRRAVAAVLAEDPSQLVLFIQRRGSSLYIALEQS